jgi:single-strand DNA-binding protein
MNLDLWVAAVSLFAAIGFVRTIYSVAGSISRKWGEKVKSVNKVFLLGHVGKDPEFKITESGMAVVTFSLATSDRIKSGNGEYRDATEWHGLVAFRKTAEIIHEYVKKGTQLYVEGKLQTSSWEDRKTGEKKYRTQIIVNELTLLGGNGQRERKEQPCSANNYAGAPRVYENPDNDPITDDDIPF